MLEKGLSSRSLTSPELAGFFAAPLSEDASENFICPICERFVVFDVFGGVFCWRCDCIFNSVPYSFRRSAQRVRYL